jgi:hypothetical protein
MKYSVHSTEAEAQAEISRVESVLGIPSGETIRYAIPEQISEGWGFRVKEVGQWKCDHIALNIQEIDINPDPIPQE